MIKYAVCVISSLFIVLSGNAQQNIKNANGQWSFTQYSKGILKCTFQPNGYHKNEAIYNAVILKPAQNKIPQNKIVSRADKGVDISFSTSAITIQNYFDSGFYKGFHFQLKPDERIYGTGERSVPLDRRGYKLPLYNTPNYGYGMNTESLNYSVPFIISSRGYGIFFDNPSRGYLDIGKAHPDVLEYGASSGELTFYLIPGKNVETVLKNFQALVGTQPVPARWVFGNLMSRFGYRSQSQLTGIADKMRADTIPFDAVIIDLFWFGDSIQQTMGNLSWDKKSWPAPEKMISDFKKENIKTILITEPYLVQKTKYFDESKRYQAVDSNGKPYLVKDFYFGPAGLLDLYRNDAQDWFWKKYVTQINKGVAGWWGDLGEPERHPSDVYHNLKDFGYKRFFSADEVHNIYGHYWDKMLFDKYAKFYPNVRLFNLNRSGYTGSGRYGVFPWSGDVGRSWSGLEAQLPVMIGMSMSGVPYIHADAGGFAGGDNDQELYTRWLQFATFTPVFRPHGTAVAELDSNQLNIPSEAALHPEPFRSIVKNFIDLRYSMLPYNYTLGYEQAKYGEPLVRPLFYRNLSDSNLLKASDEFMWGENILVSPIIEKGVGTRKLYLPEGKWYQLFTTKKYDGNQWLNEVVSLETIPVFVKEGSFIPFADYSNVPKLATTADYDDARLIMQYYPSSSQSAYALFLDDGVSKNTLEKKQFALLNIKGVTHGKDVFITITSSGSEAIKNVRRMIKLSIPGSVISQAIVNQKKIAVEKSVGIKGLPGNASSFINVPFSGKTVIIKLKIE